MGWSETEKKYLAGLLDADGCLHFTLNNEYLGLVLSLSASESIDREGKFINNLGSKVGKVYTRQRETDWSIQNEWTVRRRSDLEKLLPHITKYQVVKGNKWSWMLSTFRKYQGVKINEEILNNIRLEALNYKGPIKPKSHPTWAWTAGYLDGDGWYMLRKRKHQIEMQVGAVSNIEETEGLELLHKAFGGILKDDRGHKRWIRNLGPRDKSFAIPFLKKMVVHSNLKKWKIEQLLHTHSQRLSVSNPTGYAIV